jgi:hypothetical protein
MSKTFLETVCACLDKHSVDYTLVGGHVLPPHEGSLSVVELEFVIPFKEKAFVATEEALKSIGMRPRLPVDAKEMFEFRKEYIKNRNLIVWSFYNPKNHGEVVDIYIAKSSMRKKRARLLFKELNAEQLVAFLGQLRPHAHEGPKSKSKVDLISPSSKT